MPHCDCFIATPNYCLAEDANSRMFRWLKDSYEMCIRDRHQHKDQLTPTLVNSLIERIEVHNNDKSSGHCYVKVDVYFTAVGMIDIPTEQEILAMMEEMQKNPQQFRFIA